MRRHALEIAEQPPPIWHCATHLTSIQIGVSSSTAAANHDIRPDVPVPNARCTTDSAILDIHRPRLQRSFLCAALTASLMYTSCAIPGPPPPPILTAKSAMSPSLQASQAQRALQHLQLHKTEAGSSHKSRPVTAGAAFGRNPAPVTNLLAIRSCYLPNCALSPPVNPPPPSNRLRKPPRTTPLVPHRTTVHGSAPASNAKIPEKLKESRSRVRGCSRTGGPGCSSLPVGSCLGSVRQVVVLRTGTCTQLRPPKRA